MSARSVRWTAPGRVNLIGEHTDYNDGWVLPFALPLGVTARATARADRRLVVTSAAWPGERVDAGPDDRVSGWAGYVAGVLWALRAAGHEVGGVDVHLEADLPAGAGLSSSAAVECAVAGAVADLFDLGLDADALVHIAHTAEHDYVGVPVGVLDQSAVVRCTAGHALFLDTRTMHSRPVPLDLATQRLSVLVIDTRSPHRLVDGEYAQRRAQCARSAGLLGLPALRDVTDLDAALAELNDDVLRRRTRHVVTENARTLRTVALLEDGADARAIGPVLTASHVSLRDDYAVSSPELDLAVDTALAHGAHGARMTGGGFGGSAIALVDASAADTIADEVNRAFAAATRNAPVIFAVAPSRGAHRV